MKPVKLKLVGNTEEEVIEKTNDQVDPRTRLRGAREALRVSKNTEVSGNGNIR